MKHTKKVIYQDNQTLSRKVKLISGKKCLQATATKSKQDVCCTFNMEQGHIDGQISALRSIPTFFIDIKAGLSNPSHHYQAFPAISLN